MDAFRMADGKRRQRCSWEDRSAKPACVQPFLLHKLELKHFLPLSYFTQTPLRQRQSNLSPCCLKVSYIFNIPHHEWSIFSMATSSMVQKHHLPPFINKKRTEYPKRSSTLSFSFPLNECVSGRVQVVPRSHRGNLSVTVKIINKLHVIVGSFCCDKAWEPIRRCWQHTTAF